MGSLPSQLREGDADISSTMSTQAGPLSFEHATSLNNPGTTSRSATLSLPTMVPYLSADVTHYYDETPSETTDGLMIGLTLTNPMSKATDMHVKPGTAITKNWHKDLKDGTGIYKSITVNTNGTSHAMFGGISKDTVDPCLNQISDPYALGPPANYHHRDCPGCEPFEVKKDAGAYAELSKDHISVALYGGSVTDKQKVGVKLHIHDASDRSMFYTAPLEYETTTPRTEIFESNWQRATDYTSNSYTGSKYDWNLDTSSSASYTYDTE